jgi:hypothetical protein
MSFGMGMCWIGNIVDWRRIDRFNIVNISLFLQPE